MTYTKTQLDAVQVNTVLDADTSNPKTVLQVLSRDTLDDKSYVRVYVRSKTHNSKYMILKAD